MSEPLRLLSWNVWDMLGDPLAVARVLRSARPDVACLQEAPRRPGSRWRLTALARASGLQFVAGGRASAGTALLCSARVVVRDVEAFRLPVEGWRSRPRGAVLATAGLPGGLPLRVACVHLGLQEGERLHHARMLRHRLGRSGLPAVVAGDFNELPGGPSWRAFDGMADDPDPDAPPTFRAPRPRRRIDAVLAGPGVRVSEYARWTPDERDVRLASDHHPVLVLADRSDEAGGPAGPLGAEVPGREHVAPVVQGDDPLVTDLHAEP